MNDTPQLLALMQKTRGMRAYDCVKEFESLARKLEKENIALRAEIKSVLDALNTAANEGGFDGYDEDTPLLVNLKSHWDRLCMIYEKDRADRSVPRIQGGAAVSIQTYKPIATMITCREDDEEAMVTVGAYRKLERENAALREQLKEANRLLHIWSPESVQARKEVQP